MRVALTQARKGGKRRFNIYCTPTHEPIT